MTNVSWWWSSSSLMNLTDIFDVLPDNSTATSTVHATPVSWAAVALALIVVGTAFGNILLCVAVITQRHLQNMTNYFLASLAVADLLVAVVVMPLAVLVQIYGTYIRLTNCSQTYRPCAFYCCTGCMGAACEQ